MVWDMADASTGDPMVPPNTFGVRLAMLRAWRGWNVKQAADHCDIPEQSWHNWEAGKSPQKIHEKAKRIADRAPCDYVWLVSGMEGRQTRSEKSDRRSHLRGLPTPKRLNKSARNQTPLLLPT